MSCGRSSILRLAYLLPFSMITPIGIFDFPAIKFIMMSGEEDDSPAVFVGFLLISVALDTLFILLAFNTSNEWTVVAFLMMIYGSTIALIALKVWKEIDDEPFAFANNPGWRGALIGVGLGFVVLIINILAYTFAAAYLPTLASGADILQRINYNSVIFVPQFFSTASSGSSSVLNNAVFQLILTAPGEEDLKAAMIYGFFLMTENEAFSVLLAEAIWASLHTILVGFTLFQVFLAFISGLIWWVPWKMTGSIIPAILGHGTYNGTIVGLSAAFHQ